MPTATDTHPKIETDALTTEQLDNLIGSWNITSLRVYAAQQDPPIVLSPKGTARDVLVDEVRTWLAERAVAAADAETPTEAEPETATEAEPVVPPSAELERYEITDREMSLIPSTETWRIIQTIANDICKGMSLAPALRGKPADIALIMLAGRDVGIGITVALNKIHIIDGRPSMAAELMKALIIDRGHYMRRTEVTPTSVTVKYRRADWPEGEYSESTYTLEDAKRAELIDEYNSTTGVVTKGKTNWKHNTRAMLTWRATSEGARLDFPDVLCGISYTPEELGAEVDEAGEPVKVPNLGDHGDTGRAPAQTPTETDVERKVRLDAEATDAGWDGYEAERDAHAALVERIKTLSEQQRESARKMRAEWGWPMRPKSQFDGFAKWVDAAVEAKKAENAAAHIDADDDGSKTARLAAAKAALDEAETEIEAKAGKDVQRDAAAVDTPDVTATPPADSDGDVVEGEIVCPHCNRSGVTKETTVHAEGCPDEAF